MSVFKDISEERCVMNRGRGWLMYALCRKCELVDRMMWWWKGVLMCGGAGVKIDLVVWKNSKE